MLQPCKHVSWHFRWGFCNLLQSGSWWSGRLDQNRAGCLGRCGENTAHFEKQQQDGDSEDGTTAYKQRMVVLLRLMPLIQGGSAWRHGGDRPRHVLSTRSRRRRDRLPASATEASTGHQGLSASRAVHLCSLLRTRGAKRSQRVTSSQDRRHETYNELMPILVNPVKTRKNRSPNLTTQ